LDEFDDQRWRTFRSRASQALKTPSTQNEGGSRGASWLGEVVVGSCGETKMKSNCSAKFRETPRFLPASRRLSCFNTAFSLRTLLLSFGLSALVQTLLTVQAIHLQHTPDQICGYYSLRHGSTAFAVRIQLFLNTAQKPHLDTIKYN
jgi:hypothetical protein